jgi:prepilin-type N-terminal cleavage/methylation domain-containing protein
MMYRGLRLFHGSQCGFTILEMLVTLVLIGFISLGASMASAQVLKETTRNTDYVTASRQAMNAIFWISRDAQMAQTILGDDVFPEAGALVFTWTTWENQHEQVTYSLADGELRRRYSNDGEPVETIVAECINPDPNLTNCVSDGGVLSLMITASVGEGSRAVSVTRTHGIASRPNL